YHARALAASGVAVDLVGFEGTPLPQALTADSRISIHRLNPATLRLRGGIRGSSYAVAGLVDAARLSFRLWRTLRSLPKPDLVLEAVRWLEERIRGWEAAAGGRRFPDLVILVTGDGERRGEFERRFAGLPARRIQLRARWLEPEDYPRVVGSADLGLCLHRSSSGLDNPMKVADLFGAGVPVCALDYGACLAERVRHGDNGLLFSKAVQLADVLVDP